MSVTGLRPSGIFGIKIAACGCKSSMNLMSTFGFKSWKKESLLKFVKQGVVRGCLGEGHLTQKTNNYKQATVKKQDLDTGILNEIWK